MPNTLYYGDNLDVLREKIASETVDLCYIDPPFNSKRNYNQIYNNIGGEDRAQAQAFIDTWTWDDHANAGLEEILVGKGGRFTSETIDLIKGLTPVLKKGSLLAYLIAMTLRAVEIRRVLKPTGSFYLHCDPTASHYLKIILDSVFVAGGGEYRNEIIWKRTSAHNDAAQGRKQLGSIHDVILFYSKGPNPIWHTQYTAYDETYTTTFYKHQDKDGRRYRLSDITGPGGASKGNPQYEVMGVTRHWRFSQEKMQQMIAEGRVIQTKPGTVPAQKRYLDEMPGVVLQDVWTDVPPLSSQAAERMGYPTQKPESLLERIISASSNEGDVVLDAFCGCGTTIAVAQRLKRQWIGIDITYQSISLMLLRLKKTFANDPTVMEQIVLNGIPRDVESARALSLKKDDRVRKEFEKWAVLTYTDNRAAINEKKGADAGIDGVAYFLTGASQSAKMVFQVKSGKVGRGDIAKLNSDRQREGAELATFLTLAEPTKDMVQEANGMGLFDLPFMGRQVPRVEIVTVRQMLENEARLSLPMSLDVLKSAQLAQNSDQLSLLGD